MLYDANNDPQLFQECACAKELCHRYNQLSPSNTGQQQALLHQLLGQCRENCAILARFWCENGYHISVARDFFANHNTVILDAAKVHFGDHVFIAPNCGFYTSGHPLDSQRRNQGLEYAYPITVGDHVWIGAGVQILPGVTIDSNVVIGTESVVVRAIPDHSLAIGNPCRVIRSIDTTE